MILGRFVNEITEVRKLVGVGSGNRLQVGPEWKAEAADGKGERRSRSKLSLQICSDFVCALRSAKCRNPWRRWLSRVQQRLPRARHRHPGSSRECSGVMHPNVRSCGCVPLKV